MVDGVSNPAAAPVPPAGAAPKNPIVSAVVSLILPGVGQIINGQMKKGLILLVGWIVLWFIVFVLYFMGGVIVGMFTMGITSCLCCFLYIVPFIVNLYAAYDAYKTANDLNAGIFVKDWMS
jgi:hypothetical protein